MRLGSRVHGVYHGLALTEYISLKKGLWRLAKTRQWSEFSKKGAIYFTIKRMYALHWSCLLPTPFLPAAFCLLTSLHNPPLSLLPTPTPLHLPSPYHLLPVGDPTMNGSVGLGQGNGYEKIPPLHTPPSPYRLLPFLLTPTQRQLKARNQTAGTPHPPSPTLKGAPSR